MLQLHNNTTWPAELFPSSEEAYTAVLKLSFAYKPKTTSPDTTCLQPCDIHVLDNPIPIEPADAYDDHGDDPSQAFITTASDYLPPKAKSDLWLQGTAYPSPIQPSTEKTKRQSTKTITPSIAAITLIWPDDTTWQKTLHVYGERQWQHQTKTTKKNQQNLPHYQAIAEPLTEPLALTYADAASSLDNDDGFCSNPAGHRPLPENKETTDYPDELPAPRIELSTQPITSPYPSEAYNIPAGFGPIAPFWLPRVTGLSAASETSDENSTPVETLAEQAYNQAPLDQQFDTRFTGGETLQLYGLAPPVDNHLTHQAWAIPVMQITANQVNPQGERTPITFACDTLTINSDEQTFALVLRSALSLASNTGESHWLEILSVDIQPVEPNMTATTNKRS